MFYPPNVEMCPSLDFTEERTSNLPLKAPASAEANYFRLFINRRAYTLQSNRARPDTGRHYYYRLTSRKTGQGLSLSPTQSVATSKAGSPWLFTLSTRPARAQSGSPLMPTSPMLSAISSSFAPVSSKTEWSQRLRIAAEVGTSGSSWQNHYQHGIAAPMCAMSLGGWG